MSEIVQAVAIHFDVSLDSLLKAKRVNGRKNVPRWLAMKVCQEVEGARLSDIAKEFHVDHYSTVSQTISRLNRQLKEDTGTEQIFNIISKDLTPFKSN